jgi:hypothetical protein
MKPKDTDILAVIDGVMKRVKGVNTSKYDDSIFVWWYRKVCHLQITHIRDLIKYPDRYEYRINQLGHEDAAKLEKIRSMAKQVHGSEPEIPRTPAKKKRPSDILTSPETAKWFEMPSGSKEACCRSKRICTSSEPSPKKGIPCMFLSEIQPHAAQCSPSLKGVPSMFMQGLEKSAPASFEYYCVGSCSCYGQPAMCTRSYPQRM